MSDERGERPKKARLLFVCLGNICRSPLAESVFRHLAREHGVEHLFEIDSAGTSGYHAGAAPDRRSVAAARMRGVEVTGRSRQLQPADARQFDYIIAMDGENLDHVERLIRKVGASAKVRLLRDWDPAGAGEDVPDPYYGGGRGFEDVHDIVERSCRELLAHLLNEVVTD
jgi:protein-tyrosine phosphatase